MARTKRPAVRDPADFPPSLRRSRRNQPPPSTPPKSPSPPPLNPPPSPPKSPTPPPKSPTPPPKSPSPPPKSPTPPPKSPALPLKPQSSHLEDPIPETVGSSSIIETTLITVETETKKQKERTLTEVYSKLDSLEGNLTSCSNEDEEIVRTQGDIPLLLSPEEAQAWAIVPYSPQSQYTEGRLGFDINEEAEVEDETQPSTEPEKLFEESPKNDIPDLNILFDMPPSENLSFVTPNEDSPTVDESSTPRKRKAVVLDSDSEKRQKKKKKGKGKSKKSLTKEKKGLAAALLQHRQKNRKTTRKNKQTAPIPTEAISRPALANEGFSSQEALEMFYNVKDKVGLVDKGFHPHSINEYGFIKTVVENQHLEKMCAVPQSYNLTLLREFHAEVAVTKSPKLKVRGVNFVLSAKKINRFFGLTPPKQTYFQWMKNTANIELLGEVSSVLGVPGAQ
ncbi:hypothetical protein L6452_20746 [Arctium lappa]|uniref:Uncharacterized protein n=1 Tax=Arctium lappa TaxID=4217 RepID=A0ACB9BC86_ARCLA|nr:hypothetical protein L6452_20746 [Arctium lappa]